MAFDLKGYKIFIASPKGLDDIRKSFHETITEYNHSEAVPRGVMFESVGWEYTSPGMGRPQSIINQEVEKSDYFLLVLWDRWGSPTGDKYTSGTEEEYCVAMECHEKSEMPMRQIAAFFKSVDERRLNDPGEQLKKVLEFKSKLESEKKLFFKTFDEIAMFEGLLRRLLGQWLRDHENGNTAKVKKVPSEPLAPKDSREMDSSGGIKETVAQEPKIQRLLTEANKLANDGKLTEAENLFAKAVVEGEDWAAFNTYAIFLTRTGRLDEAEKMLEKALKIAEAIGDQKNTAASYGNLGVLYRIRGKLDEAEKIHKKALEIDTKMGNQEGMAAQYGNLGVIYGICGKLDEAEKMFRTGLKIDEKLGRLKGSAKCGNLGIIYQKRGRLDEAEEMYKKALEIYKKMGNHEGMAINYGNLGLLYKTRGQLDEAEEMHKKALEINEKLGQLEGMARDYGNLGLLYEERGDIEKAIEHWEKSRDLYKKIGINHEAEQMQGRIDRVQGRK